MNRASVGSSLLLLLSVGVSVGAAEKTNKLTKPQCLCLRLLFYSAAGEPSLTGSLPQLYDQRSVYNKTGHVTGVFPMGKVSGAFLRSEWSLSGAEGQLPISADSWNKERLFCASRCPGRDSTWLRPVTAVAGSWNIVCVAFHPKGRRGVKVRTVWRFITAITAIMKRE